MRIELVERPEIAPVTLQEAKDYCKIDTDVDDDIVLRLINGATQYVESYCNTSLITQTKIVWLNPSDVDYKYNYVDLPIGPIIEIDELNSYGQTNTETLADVHYTLSGRRLFWDNGYYWPSDVRGFDSYAVTALVGYGDDAESVPEDIKNAILMLVANWYQNREATPLEAQDKTIPYSVTAKLAPFRRFYL